MGTEKIVEKQVPRRAQGNFASQPDIHRHERSREIKNARGAENRFNVFTE